MKTLQIQDGDLVLRSGAYAPVTGRAKLTQDLRMAMGEPISCDRFHPRWGSLLPGMVGHASSARTSMQIESEVQRLVTNYIAIQRDRLERAKNAGQRSPFNLDEVISSIDDIAVLQEFDRFHVRVTLSTATGGPVTLISSVGI